LLENSSDYAYVDYYRCPNCTHVWKVSKTDPTDIRHVTPLPEKKP
jgi:hypothetical protein